MTAYTGTNTVPPKWRAGEVYTAVGKYTIGTGVVTADTFTFTDLIPDGGVEIIEAHWQSVELDTNASPTATMIVGTVDDPDGLIKSFIPGVNTTGNQQINAHSNGDLIGTYISAKKSVICTLGGTVATAQTAGDIFVFVRYYCSGLK